MKPWATINRLSIIWKSNLSDEIKMDFFTVVALSILLYGCTIHNKTHREKARWELHKNDTSYFEQILEAKPHETTAARPLTSHLKKHPYKTKKICGHC